MAGRDGTEKLPFGGTGQDVKWSVNRSGMGREIGRKRSQDTMGLQDISVGQDGTGNGRQTSGIGRGNQSGNMEHSRVYRRETRSRE